MTMNRRETIEKALRVAELVDAYTPKAFEKDDDLGLGLMAEMADVLEEVRGAMAAHALCGSGGGTFEGVSVARHVAWPVTSPPTQASRPRPHRAASG
jgi:hypothetical protein